MSDDQVYSNNQRSYNHGTQFTGPPKYERSYIINKSNYIRAKHSQTEAYIRDQISKNDGKTYSRQQEREVGHDVDNDSVIGLHNLAEDKNDDLSPQEHTGEIEGNSETPNTHSSVLAGATAVGGTEKTLNDANRPILAKGSSPSQITSINDIPAAPSQPLEQDREAKANQEAIDIAGTVGGVLTTALL
jgi:hypothetical protein